MKKITLIALLVICGTLNARADLIPLPVCVNGQWNAGEGWNMITEGVACDANNLPSAEQIQIQSAVYNGSDDNNFVVSFIVPGQLLLSVSPKNSNIAPVPPAPNNAWVVSVIDPTYSSCPDTANSPVSNTKCPVQTLLQSAKK